MRPTPGSGSKITYAIGSGLVSSLIAGGMGRVYGLPLMVIIIMMVMAALLAGLVGYRSHQDRD